MARSLEYRNGTRAKLPATPNDEPLFQPFSRDARYSRLTELPKSQVLPVAPSFTPLARKPAIDAVAHISGSLVNTRWRRCALADCAINVSIIKANEIRLIIRLQGCLATRAMRCLPYRRARPDSVARHSL